VIAVADLVADVSMERPHAVLLGAGASRAALPHGDKNGVQVPLLREVADTLGLADCFPADLRALAVTDFEAAYSQLADRGGSECQTVEDLVRSYFEQLVLPNEPNLYDLLQLCLRPKDAIFTFNWDPLLVQSRLRLIYHEPDLEQYLPQLCFLHGNVAVGFCSTDRLSGRLGAICGECGGTFEASSLLFPVEHKDYQDEGLIEREWEAVRYYLKHCFMFTIFGYSAPVTDVEAIDLLKQGWGSAAEREFEQTEIINRPGCDHEALRDLWDSFIHTHHYDISESFGSSWLGRHPRRTGEVWWRRFMLNQWVEANPVPADERDLESLIEWFKPLLAAEGFGGTRAAS
jgi:hypothetical protein